MDTASAHHTHLDEARADGALRELEGPGAGGSNRDLDHLFSDRRWNGITMRFKALEVERAGLADVAERFGASSSIGNAAG
jgi:hypothetical protein